jgi:hypothetical protein
MLYIRTGLRRVGFIPLLNIKNMYTGLLHLHSFLRWVILILLLVSIFKSLRVKNAGGTFNNGDRKAALFLLISAHITLLIGLYQWFFGPYGLLSPLPAGISVMKDAFYRFYQVEHPVGMIISIALITVGSSTVKKGVATSGLGKKAFWLFLIALIIILASIPWPFRVPVGRPWF